MNDCIKENSQRRNRTFHLQIVFGTAFTFLTGSDDGEYDFLERMLETGIDGIEAYSSYHGRTSPAMLNTSATAPSVRVENKAF
ncbi:MAG: hypothetical protein RSC76_00345 [Oscillospiraceae bacterium]